MDSLIIWLMIVNLMSQSTFSLLAPFYPAMAKDEKGVSSTIVGLVISSFSISFVLVSFLVGMYISKIGRRLVLFSGIILQAISMVGFGCIIWVDNQVLFIILSFSLRLLGGTACAFIWVAAYAMVSIKYPTDVQSKISLLEAANGAGLFVGPIFGGLIYQFTHFWVPFFAFSLITIILLPFLKMALTPDLDRVDNEDNSVPRLGYFKLLKHKRVLFSGINQFMNIIVFVAGQPLFGPRLEQTYGLSDFVVGVMFAIAPITYILSGLLFFPLIAKKFEPRTSMMCGFIILGMSCFCLGPSNLLGFPNKSLALMVIGLVILGIGAAFAVLPIIPEMLDAVDGKYPEYQSEISDNFSGIFNVAGGLGQIVGPSIAGAIDDKFGFNWTFDVVALVVFGHLAIYILVCGGFGSFARSIKATILRFKKSSAEETIDEINNSPESPAKQRLLNDSDEEDSLVTKDNYNLSLDHENISTDISFGNQNNSYAINKDD